MDINKLRNKLQQLQAPSNSGGSKMKENLLKLEPGKTVVRIVPYQHNRENPFQELYFHYEIAKRPYISPITYGRPDPVVEFGLKLKKNGSKEDWKMGKKLSDPAMRVYVPVIVRGAENEGVKFWSFGKTIYEEILGIMLDPDYGDITDPVSGRDITIEYTLPNKEAGERYAKTAIRVKPNQTPISTDAAKVEEVLTKQKNLTEIFTEPSYEELTNILREWLNPTPESNTPAAKEEEEDVFNTPAPAAKPTQSAPKTSPSDVAAAFDDLFNGSPF